MTEWGRQTSLFQLRRPAFWVFVALLGVTALVTYAEQSFFLARAPAGLVLSWMLLAFYLLPMALVVYRLDLYEREPVSLVLAALLWGAVAATALAGIANQGWGVLVMNVFGPAFASKWTAALTAPFVEETLKGLGVVLLYQIASPEFDDLMDGFVYGAMVGLGFAVVEDVFYFVVVFGGSVPGVIAGFFLRVLASGLYGHVLYSGIVGMAVAHYVTDDSPRAKRGATAAGLSALAVLAHFVWNAPVLDFVPDQPSSANDLIRIPLGLAVKGVPLLVFVAIAIVLAQSRERTVFEQLVAPEIGGAGITLDEADALESLRSRRRARRRAKRLGGRRARRLARALQRAQLDLVMLRSRTGDSDHEDVAAQRNKCASLREQLEALVPARP